MVLDLTLHPDSRCAAVQRIEVSVLRIGEDVLSLAYRVFGDLDAIAWAALKPSTRADELWKHTCFEAFVRAEGSDAYVELNFAPSSEWAAYQFEGYREGMQPAELVEPTHVIPSRRWNRYEFGAWIDLKRTLPRAAIWKIGISVVIEEKTGEKSYWALAHAPGKPDFHRADSFVLEAPADYMS